MKKETVVRRRRRVRVGEAIGIVVVVVVGKPMFNLFTKSSIV